MKIRLGDTIQFDYSAPGRHDKQPVVYFLAKVGNLVHGLNQHYQSPQEKYYYFLMLKNVLYQKLQTGTLDAPTFYKLYIRKRLISNSYRTYNKGFMAGTTLVPNAWAEMTGRKVDIKRSKVNYAVFKKGDRVRYVSMVRGKLSWVKGKVLGRKTPGANYVIQTDKGVTTHRHPADLRLDK